MKSWKLQDLGLKLHNCSEIWRASFSSTKFLFHCFHIHFFAHAFFWIIFWVLHIVYASFFLPCLDRFVYCSTHIWVYLLSCKFLYIYILSWRYCNQTYIFSCKSQINALHEVNIVSADMTRVGARVSAYTIITLLAPWTSPYMLNRPRFGTKNFNEFRGVNTFKGHEWLRTVSLNGFPVLQYAVFNGWLIFPHTIRLRLEVMSPHWYMSTPSEAFICVLIRPSLVQHV